MNVSISFREEAIHETLRELHVRHINEWACTCGCEMKVFFGWGTGEGIEGFDEHTPAMWFIVSHCYVVGADLAEVEAHITEYGLRMPIRGARHREEVDHIVMDITGGSASHNIKSLIACAQALFPKVVTA